MSNDIRAEMQQLQTEFRQRAEEITRRHQQSMRAPMQASQPAAAPQNTEMVSLLTEIRDSMIALSAALNAPCACKGQGKQEKPKKKEEASDNA